MDVGDALVEAVLDAVPHRPRSRLRDVLDWLTEITRPPVGVRLVSDDGGTFSGFVVVEDNRPILMLAIRTGGTPSHRETSGGDRYMPPFDDELWRGRTGHPFK